MSGQGAAPGPGGGRFDVVLAGKRFDPATRASEAGAEGLQPAAAEGRPAEAASGVIVQVRHPLRAAEAEHLRTLGLRLAVYVPELAYLERLSPRQVDLVRADPLVRAVVPHTSDLKISPEAQKIAEGADDEGPGLVNIVLFDDADVEATLDLLRAVSAHVIGVTDLRDHAGWVTVRARIAARQLPALGSVSEIRWVEPVPEIKDDAGPAVSREPLAGIPPAAAPGSVQVAWSLGLAGQGQVIGVLDNGPADLGHAFFRDADGIEPGPTHRKVVALRNARRQAPHRHATFVAGCAAGDDVTSPGAALHRGWAWAAKLVVGNRRDLAVFHDDEGGTTLHAELLAAASAGAHVHTNSWHTQAQGQGAPALYDLTAAEADAFSWENEEHVVLGSAGNSVEEQGSPGAAKNSLCVSAAREAGRNVALGDGAAGPTADGRLKPDLMAAACDVMSAVVGTSDAVDGKLDHCASSYATPFAAAAAAIVRQWLMEGRHRSGTPTPSDARTASGALLRALLLDSTVPTTDGGPRPGPRTGWGALRLDRIVAPGPGRRVQFADVRHADGLDTAQERTHVVRVAGAGGEPLRVTLVWSDAPGTPGAAIGVVNDLDLIVTSPSAVAFLGNVIQGGVSVPGGEPDRLNSTETVLVPEPESGTWRITVRAERVNAGRPRQGYALVASGGLEGGSLQ